MQQTNALIPVIYCRVIIALVSQYTKDINRLLAGTGITPEDVNSLDITMTRQGYRQLLRNTITVSGNDAMMLEMGLKLPVMSHGSLGYACALAPNRRLMLELFDEFVSLRSNFIHFERYEQGGIAELHFVVNEHLETEIDIATDAAIGVMMNLLRSNQFSKMSYNEVYFKRPPPKNNQRFQQLLGCEIKYNQAFDGIRVATQDLDMEQLGFIQEDFAAAKQKCRDELSGIGFTSHIRHEIETILNNNPGQLWSIDIIAKRLCMSVSTLQRRLRQEGWRYCEIQEDWLKSRTIRLLEEEKFSIEMTSALLGYYDQANFRRAFKRWFGSTPRQWLHKSQKTNKMTNTSNLL